MCTRGIVGFREGSRIHIYYSHCDTYPEGVGYSIVSMLRTGSDKKYMVEALGLENYGYIDEVDDIPSVQGDLEWAYIINSDIDRVEIYRVYNWEKMIRLASIYPKLFKVRELMLMMTIIQISTHIVESYMYMLHEGDRR